MFTGIVQERLTITAITPGNPMIVCVSLPQWGPLALGESILLHGICSTVIVITAQDFTVEYMAETVRRTTVGDWQVGDQIHAEPALTLQTKLSGNLVYGHVDCTAVVVAPALTVEIPDAYQSYLINQGSITINGVNLTIVTVAKSRCTVNLIPETARRTSLADLAVGNRVNIEFDYLTKVIVESVRRHDVGQ